MSAPDPTRVWLVVGLMTVVTYALRSGFLLNLDRREEFPETVEAVLPFIPIAVLAGLVTPGLLLVDAALAVGPGNARLLAGVVAFGVAWVTESIFATVGVGMAALWVLLWL